MLRRSRKDPARELKRSTDPKSPRTGALDPDDDRKPDSPMDLTKPSWVYTLRSTIREFIADGCVDLAAGLTYRTVFSIFPALIALVSILSIFGQSGTTVSRVLEEAENLVPADTWNTIEAPLEVILSAPAPGVGLVVGLVTALWTASGYVKAFGRAMNTVYGVPEGRGIVKLNVQMYLFTAFLLLLGAIGLMVFVLSGPVAEQIGSAIGLGSTAIAVWNIARWVVLAAIIVLLVALLYYATPNVRQPKLRWVSVGAVIAIVVSVLASAGFFFYVVNFASYNVMYGALAGVMILLLWLYIVNAILLLGAEIDSELERARQLQAGIAAEVDIQLPPRDTKASDKKAEKLAADIRRAQNLRRTAGRSQTKASSDEPS